jgi:hypothetical protein
VYRQARLTYAAAQKLASLQIANVGKVSLRNIGLRSRVERLDYWDGVPD